MERTDTVSYTTREEMYRDVQRRGSEGWEVLCIRKCPGNDREVEYARRGQALSTGLPTREGDQQGR